MEAICKNREEQQACVPFFAHENAMMHYNQTNKRMLIALVTVCVTLILTIITFVFGYTARERNWLNAIREIAPQMEVADGIYKQSD